MTTAEKLKNYRVALLLWMKAPKLSREPQPKDCQLTSRMDLFAAAIVAKQVIRSGPTIGAPEPLARESAPRGRS